MASELEVNKAKLGTRTTQGDALLGARANGDSINFGHGNQNGYGSNIGCGNNNGHPYVAFSCEHGTNDNTFKTRGLLGNVIQATNNGELKFSQVTTADADNQTATERLTIASNGNVSIGGVTSPDGTLHVHTASAGTVTADTDRDDLVIENSANVGMTFLSPNTNKQEIAFGDPENSRMGLITYNHDDDSLAFKVNNVADRLKIASDGLCTFSNGIAFSAPDPASAGTPAASSVLDVYEEGTWTPVFSAGASSSGTWDTTLAGEYTRIGNLVTASMKITGGAMDFSSAAGYRTYTGLPFTGTLKGAGAVSTSHAASFSGTTSTNVGTKMTIIPAETGSGSSEVLAQATYRV